MRTGSNAARFGGRLLAVLETLMVIVLIAMVLLTMVDVIGRYFLNRPVPGTIEVIELMLALLVFGTLPLATLGQEHIVVDIFTPAFHGWFKRVQQTLMSLIGAVVLGFIGWQLWRRGVQLAGYGDLTAYLKLPVAPVAYAMSTLSFLSSALLLALSVQAVRGTLRPPPSELENSIRAGS